MRAHRGGRAQAFGGAIQCGRGVRAIRDTREPEAVKRFINRVGDGGFISEMDGGAGVAVQTKIDRTARRMRIHFTRTGEEEDDRFQRSQLDLPRCPFSTSCAPASTTTSP